MKIIKLILHLIIIISLTILTQIGGIVYVISILLISKNTAKKRIKRIGVFATLYLIATFLIVPFVAPIFGREKVTETNLIQANTFFTKLTNRNYVRPQLNKVLKKTAIGLNKKYSGIKLIYLDANFPFIDKFPLLPHLSHNDGKKIDLSLIYSDKNQKLTNEKPSVSGYGVYAAPTNKEYNQITVCEKQGYWQYDFPKYLTFGKVNNDILFSKRATKFLITTILKQQEIGKLFIEPHLKNRMQLNHKKIRFHGCRAVRHDDHIHIQLK